MKPKIPDSFPVAPLLSVQQRAAAVDPVHCETCGHWWDDALPTEYTPAPAGRCPFEQFHDTQSSPDTIHQEIPIGPARVSIGMLLQAQRERVVHECRECGREFVGILIAEYCSDRCRNLATYARRKAARRASRANRRAMGTTNAEETGL